MKNYYYVVSIERNGNPFAYVKAINGAYNLRGLFPEDAQTITAMPTKKAAIATAETWLKTWVNDGKQLAFNYDIKYGAPVIENSRAYWE